MKRVIFCRSVLDFGLLMGLKEKDENYFGSICVVCPVSCRLRVGLGASKVVQIIIFDLPTTCICWRLCIFEPVSCLT